MPIDKKTKHLGEAFLWTLQYDLPQILKEFFKEDVYQFTKNTGKGVLTLTYKLLKLPYDLGIKVKNEGLDGLKKSVSDGTQNTKELAKELAKLPKRLRQAINKLFSDIGEGLERHELKKEQSLYIARLLSYFISFSTGVVAGYSFPDKDIGWLGIGKHRNIFTHSVLPLIFIKLLAQLLLRIINKTELYLEESNDERDILETLKIVKNHLGALALGTSVGVGSHLIIDGVFQPGGTIRGPGFNTIIHGTTVDDQAFLLINSFFCILLGYEINKEVSSPKRASA